MLERSRFHSIIQFLTLARKGNASRIYVTAFPNRSSFRKHATDIAWETEVWIADNPDHMIHFDGEKFLGPYKEHPTGYSPPNTRYDGK